MSDNYVVVQQQNKMIEDQQIKPGLIDSLKAPQRTLPTYLVWLEITKQQKDPYFLAVKYDDSFVHCAKFVGFYTNAANIRSTFSEVIKNTDITNFIEVQIPWNRIIEIQNLIYRHKQTK